MKVGIVGRGKVGRALHRALRASDSDATLTSGRRPAARTLASREVLILAVPDDAITTTAVAISQHARPGSILLHCAGARRAEELRVEPSKQLEMGVMHPLVSLPNRTRFPDFTGTTFVLGGSPKAVAAAKKIARAVGARGLSADVHGAAYHAAAAMAANGSAALAAAAVNILTELGMEVREAERAVGALLRTVSENIVQVGLPDALSGPVRRGDAKTVAAHRKELAQLDRSLLQIYDSSVPPILHCATEAGLEPSKARAIQRALGKKKPS